MSLLDRARVCRRWNPDDYWPFVVDGRQMGWVTHALARRLADFPALLAVGARGVELRPGVAGYAARSQAMDELVEQLIATGHVPRRRGELYPVLRDWQETPLFALDRGAVPVFGVRSFGVHLNGYVEDAEGLKLWVGRRSMSKPTAPGKLDHLVAGGQPLGLTPWANLLKECHEEAGLAAGLAAGARSAGLLSYRCAYTDGQRDDVLFVWDLALPPDWRPDPQDDEVESFHLWPIEQVIRTLRDGDDFKFNVALVVIDFLIRHGLVGPGEPGFQEICWTLRSGGP